MATGESYFARPYFLSSPFSTSDHVFDFEESDIWNTTTASAVLSSSPDEGGLQNKPSSGGKRKSGKKSGVGCSSLPMNIPDWSKILRGDQRENRHDDDEETEEEEEGGGVWFPPHELLARRQGSTASFSVHEGIGRTLKGRDLSRVRNAIWKQTGFED